MKKKYGIDWPDNYHDVFIDMVCAKHWQEEPYCHANLDHPADHLLRACRRLLSSKDFTISSWSEEHAKDWTETDFCITWGGAACSKAQPLDALVYTPDGPRKMGDLQPGDLVCTPDSGVATVVKIHDVGMQQEYRVSFTGGVSVLCAADHRWEIYRCRSGQRQDVSTLELSELQTAEIKVLLTNPVVYRDRGEPKIDPYLLGALLGDGYFGGRLGRHNLRFCSADSDILDRVRATILPGYHLTPCSGRPYDFSVSRDHRGRWPPHKYKKALRDYGLWGTICNQKFVPDDYLYGSIATRWEVLRGLLDTDGTCKLDGQVVFTSVSAGLAGNVAEIVRSLGGRASEKVDKEPKFKANDGSEKTGQPLHLVRIVVPDMASLFHCARKKKRTRRRKRNVDNLSITGVRQTGRVVTMKCITIDSARHAYLTNNHIVTKNSNDYGLFSVMDWATDPLDTIVLMASTTREMLKIRSYESVVRYFKLLKSNPFFLFPGKESKTTVAILNVDDDDAPSTTKSSIRGSAVNEGGSLQGAHLPYVRLILDELSEMKPHGMNARSNLSKGCRNFKCFGICNPTSFYDEGSKYSVPIDGWAAVTPDDTMWETRWGRVRHHDGLKSPAITEPGGVKKYPHLINQAQIDRQIKEEDGNVEARDVWIFVRGFPPRSGVDDTVLTPELIQVHKMQQPPVWLTPKEKLIYVAGLDAAFTSGGDDCIVKIGAIGTTTDYINTLAFVDTIKLPIVAGSERPATYQVVDGLRPILEKYNIPVRRLCVDDSGTQSVADVIEVEIGHGVLRLNSGVAASDAAVSPQDVTPANTKYVDAGTESWIRLAGLGKQNRIRGMSDRCSNEFCIRRLVVAGRRKRLEKKSEFKTRLKGHRSPDDGDGSALCARAARPQMSTAGVEPGSNAPRKTTQKRPGVVIKTTIKPSNYVDT